MVDKLIGLLLKEIRESKRITQDEAAKFLDVDRNAIVRIEQGKRKISVGELYKIEKLYNINLDEYLEDNEEVSNAKGIILAGGSGTRLYPITRATSKQLTSIYDKPMIYYPLSVLMKAGIKDILIITTPEDQDSFKRLLGDGSQFGINLTYIIQPSPDGLAQAFILGEEFIGNDPCAMILGDNIYYGHGLGKELKKGIDNANHGYATIYGYKVKDPERFGIMEVDKFNNVLSVEEKPEHPKSDYAITGLYFYPSGVSSIAKTLKPSARGELEITSLNDYYLKANKLKSRLLLEGFTWYDTGTFDSLLEASNMIRAFQKNNDSIICCPEEIGYKNGWLSLDKLKEAGELMKKNTYGQHLLKVVAKEGK